MSRLRAHNLIKRYRDRTVVDGVSLEVNRGEVVGLLGPNGAGKTTSFYMIVGLVKADSGMVSLDEDDLTATPMHVRATMGIGYLPQETSVFRRLTVTENIQAVLQTRPELSKTQQRSLLDELLDELSIGHLRDNTAMSLSGGEKRRLEIARALAVNPSFMLLDEPFAGVDPISVIDIQRIVSHLSNRGIGVLITDHSVRETLGICSRAYIINQGTVMTEGTPQTILADQQVRDVYLGHQFQM